MKKNGITEYFEEVETEEEYDGYFCSISELITISILGSICGLRNVRQIHQWASSARVSGFLKERFGIEHVPCYYWMLCLLKMIKTDSLNLCFMNWVSSFLPENMANMTISLDGKTICSTNRISKMDSPLHIVSAQISELGLTLAQRSTDAKSNEIKALQELLKTLHIEGQMITADALNCQKETAKIIIEQKADYLLCAKDNQPALKKDIEEYVQDDELRETMDMAARTEKNYGRIETRTAYVTSDIAWMQQRSNWKGLSSIGAIHTESSSAKGNSSEWRYYISSRKLSAEELLHHARMEWSVETMHWLLDVHFEEDWCLVEDKHVQQHLNMFRKAAINLIKQYKTRSCPKKPISNVMLDCLIDDSMILKVISEN